MTKSKNFKVTFEWIEEVTTTRQVIVKAVSAQHAESLVTEEIGEGYRDEIGVEIDKEFDGDADCYFTIKEVP